MKDGDPCRFCRIYAGAVMAFAALLGALMTLQATVGLQKFGGADYVPRLVLLSGLRSLAPAVVGSALLVAFVVWAHPLPIPRLEAELPRFIKRGLLLALPAYLVALALLVGVALLISNLAFAVPWAAGAEAVSVIRPNDWLVGASSALLDAGLVSFLAWRYLARLQAGKSSLPTKLVLAWTFATGLRMTLGVVLSLFLSS